MDYWKKEIPMSSLPYLANSNTQRLGSDENDSKDHLENSITYSFNEYGYRSDSFQNIDNSAFNILVCGASSTVGIGVPVEKTWPQLLKGKFKNSRIFNLAVQGASGDFVTRTVFQTIEIIKPDIVSIFWPDASRFEVIKNHTIKQFGVWYNDYPAIFADDDYQNHNLRKNIEFVKALCACNNSHFTSIIENDFLDSMKTHELYNSRTENELLARDGIHIGPWLHQLISERMYEQYINCRR